MDLIKHLLNKELAKKGLGNLAQAALVCQIADSLFGKEFQAISYKNKVLEIKIKDSYQAITIQTRSEEIIKKINQKIGYGAIERIRFRIN